MAALVVSLALHALVLGALDLPKPREARRPLFEVSLTGSIVARREPARAAVPAPARDIAPVPAGAPAPPPTRTTPERAAAAPPSPPPAPPATPEQPRLVPADLLTDPPLPQSNPFAGDPEPALHWRRLPTMIWIDSDGLVLKVIVANNEIAPELAEQLQQAVARIRFTPGRVGSLAVGTQIETRLCFDGEGRLQQDDPRCLRVADPAPPAAAPPPASQER